MGNRAKRDMAVERSLARMRAEDARRAAMPDPTPRCVCGHTAYDGLLWAVQGDHGRTTFRCPACLPEDAQ